MWSRKTIDPLGKLLFEKYGMHFLSRPRADISVLQVFAARDGAVFQSGGIDGFLRSKLDKPAIASGEPVMDIEGTTADVLAGNASASFLQGFLALLGAGAAKSVSLALEKSHSTGLRFRFGDCARDHVK